MLPFLPLKMRNLTLTLLVKYWYFGNTTNILMAKILITGSNGQLGISLKEKARLYPGIQFVYTDLNELDITNHAECHQYISTLNPDFIINCAAYTAVDKAETDVENCYLLNAEAVKSLSDAAKLSNARLIHISTDYVFSGRHFIPYHETDIPDPESVYGQSKLKGEESILGEDHVIIIRTSWLYSVHGHNFFRTMHRLTNGQEVVRVIYDQTGTPTYAPDLANVILQIVDASLEDRASFFPGIYHYSAEGITSWYDFACEIAALSGHKATIIPVDTSSFPLPAPRPFYSVLNKMKIKEIYSIEIPHWKESLSVCIKEYNKNT